ncbi:MAG: TetR/AcrR family transcriptional regulator, tetracycline repressor protein [Mycobacterium sp.]|nr:TetR/AcrR family transcriptional regulator, tetracycline repressor protein [Mycobacterium sp.]MDT5239512.1 TetR/AcrR family transcriptional regulator, tetracycline repressor protein [Mycobacterium sp.]MDT5264578.1 TetR/AcrR family transcriptional regulator, tetracycline repressor protein [Mycobacterium sp.]MDT5292048.1 TetR/AcrR family transcriptional regulator, tetracycline repressor protein [Mycobacterium sp.]MDT5298285.1 TetR/AcrR family transcriptional regulator, tetracycline repressor p
MQLHRRDVVDKATQLLDDYGIADLTMRRLARELSVSPGALYWHFADKQELLGAVADRILEPTSATVDDASWSRCVVGVCTALRDALLSFTDGAELVSASFAAGKSERMTEILTRLTTAAAQGGIDPANADLAGRTVLYYVLGFTADEQSRLQWDAAGALVDGQSVLTENPNARFAFGLKLLVDGIAAHSGAEVNLSQEKFE